MAVVTLGLMWVVGVGGCSRKTASAEKKDKPRLEEPLLMASPEAPPETRRPAAGPGGGASSAKLYIEARNAWLAGQCELAIGKAEQGYALKPSTRHVAIIGACACTLGRVQKAQWAFSRLRGGNRNMMVQVCSARGIKLMSDPGMRTSFPSPTPAPSTTVVPSPTPVPSTPPDPARAFYVKARTAWLRGQCGKAMRMAEKSQAFKPATRNLSIIGACACSLRREAKARQVYEQLKGPHRNMLRAICRTKGITLK